MKIFKIN